MAKIATRETKLGNVLKYEQDPFSGIARGVATVNVTANMEIGAVVQSDGDGTYSIVAAADVATLSADVAVVIDSTLYDSDATGDRAIAVLNGGGDAIVVREQLKFADALSAGQIDTVVAALEAKRIKVESQI
jgi:hypothetical protein